MRPKVLNWGATAEEAQQAMLGDEILPNVIVFKIQRRPRSNGPRLISDFLPDCARSRSAAGRRTREKGFQMASLDTSSRAKDPVSILRRLDELRESQKWAHHAVELQHGKVRSSILSKPVTNLSRAQRLSRLGTRFDGSIFGGPSYRLTAKVPFNDSPEAWLVALNVGLYIATDENKIVWELPPEGDTSGRFGIEFFFDELPEGLSVVSLTFEAKARPGQIGHLLIEPPLSQVSAVIPITDAFVAHTVDVTFIPQHHSIFCSLINKIEFFVFRSVDFHRARPDVVATF